MRHRVWLLEENHKGLKMKALTCVIIMVSAMNFWSTPFHWVQQFYLNLDSWIKHNLLWMSIKENIHLAQKWEEDLLVQLQVGVIISLRNFGQLCPPAISCYPPRTRLTDTPISFKCTLCLIIIACLGSQTKVPRITFQDTWTLATYVLLKYQIPEGKHKILNTRKKAYVSTQTKSSTSTQCH